MEFRNLTALDEQRLHRMLLRHTAPFRHERLQVLVRYSRGADFSGRCFYRDNRIFINLGRHLRFPYSFGTNLAKARSTRTRWWRDCYQLTVTDAYQLTLFIYLHELYHHLVKAAGHNHRRKESRCDRFAARILVDDYSCRVQDRHGQAVERELWDFQDLEAFVAKAPRTTDDHNGKLPIRLRDIPVRVRGVGRGARARTRPKPASDRDQTR